MLKSSSLTGLIEVDGDGDGALELSGSSGVPVLSTLEVICAWIVLSPRLLTISGYLSVLTLCTLRTNYNSSFGSWYLRVNV